MVSHQSKFTSVDGERAIRNFLDSLSRKSNENWTSEAEEIDSVLGPMIYESGKTFDSIDSPIVLGASPPFGRSDCLDPKVFGCGTDLSPFLALIFSRGSLEKLKHVGATFRDGMNSTLISIDGTNKVTRNGYQTLVISALDAGHKCHVLAHAVMSHKDARSYARVFSAFRFVIESNNVGVEGDLSWKLTMTDAEDAIVLGIQQVYTSVVPLMCWFHVTQAMEKKIHGCKLGPKRREILSIVELMHHSRNKVEFAVR
jgi:hypothetical protein